MMQTALRSEEFFPDAREDEFYYGHRTVISYDEKGEFFFTRRPLTTGVYLKVSESGDRISVFDARTSEELLSAEERAEEAGDRAEKEKARADSAEEKLRRLEAKLAELGITG
jgi:hypothetical protein